MRSVRFGLYGIVFAAIYLAASAIALGQSPPSSVQIFMPNGATPPRSLRLEVARDDGLRDVVFTDSKGLFQIATPKLGITTRYTVTIEGDRQTFDTTTFSVTLYGGTPGQTPVFLRPITSKRRPANGVLDVASLEGNVPAKARAAYKRAMESISESQFESAISSLKQAINAYPEYIRALNDLGVVFMKLERLDEAAATFSQAIGISQRFFYPRLNLGIVLNRQGKYRKAVEVLRELYSENRGMLEVRLLYAKALEGAGELLDAEKVYRSSLEAKSISKDTRADLQFYLGVVLNREGKYAEAVVELEKGLAIDEDANSHLQLGAALMQLPELAKAEQELLRAYELGGHSAGAAQLLLGNIYYGQQRFGEAQRAFEQYLKDVPSAPNAPQITQLIAQLTANPKN